MNPRRAYLLGAYLGDGCLHPHKRGCLFTLLSIDKDLIERLRYILQIEFDSHLTIQTKDRYFYITSMKTDVCKFLLVHCQWTKEWPSSWKSWDRPTKFEFLCGLLDTDGYSSYTEKSDGYTNIRVGFCSTSNWIHKVRELSEHLGIRVGKVSVSNKGQKNGHKGKKTVYCINLKVRDMIDVRAYFRVKRKQARLIKYATRYNLSYPHRPYAEHI